MRGILRGLYNSIFRRLPLRFLLILLVVFSVLFACTRADNYFTYNGYFGNFTNLSNGQDFNVNNYISQYIPSSSYKNYVCVQTSTSSCYFTININGVDVSTDSQGLCWNLTDTTLVIKNRAGRSCPALVFFPSEELVDNLKDPSTSSQCQEMYSLIPVSSVDSNYCTTNGLCPSCPSCPSGTGGINWSSLFINDIQHLGGENIYITIPEEISWDYSYSDDDMNIDIEGYNVDTDYINSIIGTQSYTPSSSDFSKVVLEIIPLFVPGLVVILFLYFVFRFIKKIF